MGVRTLIIICVAAVARQRLWEPLSDAGSVYSVPQLLPNQTAPASPASGACASWCAAQGSNLGQLQRCHATCLLYPALARLPELLEASRREGAHRAADGSAVVFASFFAQGARGAEVPPCCCHLPGYCCL